eukprot:CAMPEP_0202712960 /NCGR_PEP_ID=MMETSP1385-20130828/47589_1 /ASSEMBLY_ACC=CAM_ASM_000861 /TAXON_ID=933848 /ORGANISM="Elphidium margaritaceum" /LENGTH=505 /DNA_ID=CAMNT_0049373161 /DNA_START=392 /DNA_END=1909 /DNA_ORIENTATION=+
MKGGGSSDEAMTDNGNSASMMNNNSSGSSNSNRGRLNNSSNHLNSSSSSNSTAMKASALHGHGHSTSAAAASHTASGDHEDEKDEYSMDDLLTAEPTLREVQNADERKTLFIKKLKLCCIIFDFIAGEPVEQNRQLAKEMKRTYLLELVEYISQSKHWFSEDCVPVILEMIGKNLFRSLPPPVYDDFDPEEDEPNFDPSWPHLQFVYEFFHRFVMTADVKVIRRYIDKRFLLNMIDLFNSEDPRERDYLKMILHRIYGRCMPFRSFIRKAMNNILYPVIYLNVRHNGISELLEILGSIINGFALPLKEEHILFLRNVLIPMHKVSFLSQFHAQLAYCVTQFIQKDPSLASSVLGGMLKFWPSVSCQKELLFLNELEEVLELTGTQQLERVIEPLFMRIAHSICSNHFQVAERALFLWNNDIIATFTSDHRKKILPIIYPALQKNYSKHWNSTVSSLTLNIIRIFKEMDKELYEEVARNYKNGKSSPTVKKQSRDLKWKKIQEMTQ